MKCPIKPKKKRKKKDSEVRTDSWLAYNGIYYKVNTVVCVNNDVHFGG